jgi:transposase-like protein
VIFAGILQARMSDAIDAHVDRMAALDRADCRNGSDRRHLLTERSKIALAVPRTCRCAPMPGGPRRSTA